MKKIHTYLTALSLQLIVTHAIAQTAEPALATVTYEFIHVSDTNNRATPVREEMFLCLGENSTKYLSYIIESNRQKARKAAESAAASSSAVRSVSVVGAPMAVVYGPGYTQEILFQHTKENKLNKVATYGMSSYLIETPLPKIDWKITKETREIGNFKCQKATGNYAGRTYTAWFAPDLPFKNGPWKLSGLPGLILEATDSKNEVLFLFKEISKDTTGQDTGINTERLITTSEKAFERAKETWINDPVGVMQSQLPAGSTAKVRLSYRDSTRRSSSEDEANSMLEKYRKDFLPRNNNPLELTKK
ncbi:MAG: GLPGLI family protein [Chitinophagaceae bacterium]